MAITTREFRNLAHFPTPRVRLFKLLPTPHKTTWPTTPMPAGTAYGFRHTLFDPKRSWIHQVLPSHLMKDTRHLIAVLYSLSVTNSCKLFTRGVESLYTNVPIPDGLETVAKTLGASFNSALKNCALFQSIWLQWTSLSPAEWCCDGSEIRRLVFSEHLCRRMEKESLTCVGLEARGMATIPGRHFRCLQSCSAVLPSSANHLNDQHPRIKLRLTFPITAFITNLISKKHVLTWFYHHPPIIHPVPSKAFFTVRHWDLY